MRINKKVGFAFLIFGLILLIIGVMFTKNSSLNGEIDDNNSSISHTFNSYVKSKNMESRAKVNFKVPSDYKASQFDDEYFRTYSNENEDKQILVSTFEDSKSLDEYIAEYNNNYSNAFISGGIKVVVSDIACNYSCNKYEFYKDNKLEKSQLNVFIKPSTDDIVVLTYVTNKESIKSEVIDDFLSNISLSSDAKYTIGSINSGQLFFEFDTNDSRKVKLSLDSNKYIENEDVEINGNIKTVVINKATNTKTKLTLKHRLNKLTVVDDIEYSYSFSEEYSKKEKIEVNNEEFIKYTINNTIFYVYVVDDNNGLIIEPENDSIELNDFINIIVK